MKSSRLLSILLLLQSRGRMTAAQLADQLEVSVRTIYRDMDSLHMAGVPLYGDAGHDGGYRLLDGYRTRLTGLNANEAEALFLNSVPGPAVELGLGPALAAAQLKLRAALPSELREQADRIASRFHFDAPGWYVGDDDARFLPEIADAVWHHRAMDIRYRRWKEPTDVDRHIEPYGLVLKGGRWYVVAGPGPRTFRIDQILAVTPVNEEFEPPADFDLAAYWRDYQEDFLSRLYRGTAIVRLSPRAAASLSGPPARAVVETGVVEAGGWVKAVVPVESIDHAHREFLAMGADVEVLGPPELRSRLAASVAAMAARYAEPAT